MTEPARLTQTSLGQRGNCWQTCVAALLGVPVEALPDQSLEKWVREASYNNALQAYLGHHHGLTYAEIEDWKLGPQISFTGFHVLCGPTERTTPENRLRHVILGKDGQPWWDPHPSRAGLTKIEGVGLLVPVHERICTSRTLRGLACECRACDPASSAAVNEPLPVGGQP